MAAVNFNINFIYILAGWEGTAHNYRVLDLVKRKGFKALPGRYYLTDARYSNTPITLTLYYNIKYYLYK